MIRLLVFTTLYPNVAQPHHGIFVEQRLRHLLDSGQVQARVLAPVPWFPSSHPRFGRYAAFASVPRFERRHGIDIWHPRYPVIPRIGMSGAPWLLGAMAWPALKKMQAEQEFDVIDAHYFYPDGVAAVWLARRLKKPVFVTGRGADLNAIARYPVPRKAIVWAAKQATSNIVVARSLGRQLEALGVPSARIVVLPNGVDLTLFQPGTSDTLSRDFGLPWPVLLSVGHLIPRKGHDIVVDAVACLPRFSLVIVGDGPDKAALHAQIKANGLESRVRLVGAVPHELLSGYYRAAFALVLASSSEGMPNVMLESLASGTPVVASAVDGIPEVMSQPEAGRMVHERTAEAFADAIEDLASYYPDRAATRHYAQRFGWDATTKGQLALFERAVTSSSVDNV